MDIALSHVTIRLEALGQACEVLCDFDIGFGFEQVVPKQRALFLVVGCSANPKYAKLDRGFPSF